MDTQSLLDALILGLIEGLTEFIPVSSTGHLLLAGHFLGFQSPGRAFEVLIQLGAILAILTVYFRRIIEIIRDFPSDPATRRFVYGVLIAFLPAVIIGVAAHGFIKAVLFESPMLVCIALILGGFVLLIVDRLDVNPRYHDATRFPLGMYFVIGLAQCLAMIPGVSRSGSTVVAAMLLGGDKRSAAEFSFFLALPTMAGAFAYDLYKNRDAITGAAALDITIGFIAAFVTAVFVVRHLLDFVSRRGFAPFAYWRILVGSVGLAALLTFG
ncbi:undecaprenyl-diphosphatase [Kaistia algarum]|jgi:undecaprenyl-diphosphatase|uniref:undecaprenyl-diphosphate phosphatase n=1 Tax=Kaistia algarum TaxID=2083279 RepID=UPI000CE72ED1|nr:undecaprenyl-diphosphate phosphatase [Kaistia algarum]MCX5513822.1 undecaprenyl-diphosphate phosphatase [Kaistia algarum]PPE79317.1 undecaprenyl-diphosphatase [Kaistia algarum]